jgi:hypothetical protein
VWKNTSNTFITVWALTPSQDHTPSSDGLGGGPKLTWLQTKVIDSTSLCGLEFWKKLGVVPQKSLIFLLVGLAKNATAE